MSTNELMSLIAQMGRHYRQGGPGYTWLDTALDVVGEHGYIVLRDNGGGDRPAAILINDETLDYVRQLIHQQRELGKMVDRATGAGLARIDEARATIAEALADVFEQLLLEAGLLDLSRDDAELPQPLTEPW